MIQQFGCREDLHRLKTNRDDKCLVCDCVEHGLTDGNYGAGFLCRNKTCKKMAKFYNICPKCNNGIHVFQKFYWWTNTKRKHQIELLCKLCQKKIIINIWQQDSHIILYYTQYGKSNDVYGVKIRKPISGRDRHFILQKFNFRCIDCGITNQETSLHIDHIVPVSKGGTNDLENLQVLCKTCNLSKHTDEWVGGQ